MKNEGLTKENQSMKAIGYKEVLSYLDGEYDLERAKELIKQHSRNYAKRQLTFLRGMKDVHFVQVENKEQTKKEISSLIQNWIDK